MNLTAKKKEPRRAASRKAEAPHTREAPIRQLKVFAGSSIAELAAAQKIKPLRDPSILSGGFPEEEDVDAFLEEIYTARR